MNVTVSDIRKAIEGLGASGYPLCVHSSLSSFGWVEGGARAIIDGLLAEGCTMLVPTFSGAFGIPPPPGRRIAQNACDYDAWEEATSGIGRVFTPDTDEIDGYMGTIPAALLKTERRVRGNHPLSSFTAVGPVADELIAGQAPMSWFAPLETLVKKRGFVVLMGVGLTRMTLIHLAEHRAGRNIFIRWANGPDGKPMEVQVGGCSRGFGKFERVLAPLGQQVTVGRSNWRVFPAQDVLEAAEKAIRADPMITHCGDPDCARCDDAVRGGPGL